MWELIERRLRRDRKSRAASLASRALISPYRQFYAAISRDRVIPALYAWRAYLLPLPFAINSPSHRHFSLHLSPSPPPRLHSAPFLPRRDAWARDRLAMRGRKRCLRNLSKRAWPCDKQGQPQGGCNGPALRGLRIAPACHIGKRQVLRWVRLRRYAESAPFLG